MQLSIASFGVRILAILVHSKVVTSFPLQAAHVYTVCRIGCQRHSLVKPLTSMMRTKVGTYHLMSSLIWYVQRYFSQLIYASILSGKCIAL